MKASIRIMLKLRGSTFLLSYIAAMAMSSCSCVGLAGAPSTLIHSFLTIGTILHPSCYSKFVYVYVYVKIKYLYI